MQTMEEAAAEPATSAAICGVQTAFVNVWEGICAHACKCKKNSSIRAFDGVVCGVDCVKWNFRF